MGQLLEINFVRIGTILVLLCSTKAAVMSPRLVLTGDTEVVYADNLLPSSNYSTTDYSISVTAGKIGVCESCVCGVGREVRIVNGDLTSTIEFPWAVAITYQGMHHCGGSLITGRHVLTAGHCLNGYDKKQFRLRFADKKKYRIKGLHVHKKYDRTTYNNDIAIIELDQPVPLDGLVKTVCLPDALRFHYIGMTGVAIGWGRIGEGEPTSKKLRKVDLPILSETECEKSNYPKGRFTENMFCAGYMGGERDSCNGDSGGALHVRNQLGAMEVVGLVSFGRGCARPKFPGVYTKVTNYMNWIADQIKGECICSMPKDIIQSLNFAS